MARLSTLVGVPADTSIARLIYEDDRCTAWFTEDSFSKLETVARTTAATEYETVRMEFRVTTEGGPNWVMDLEWDCNGMVPPLRLHC